MKNKSRHQRAGVSLLEVLFSMLLVTVGLFGAIALLPVAAQQAKRGRIADAYAAAGEAAVNEFFVRGMDKGSNWFAPSNPPVASPYTLSLAANTSYPLPEAAYPITNANHFFTAAPSSGMGGPQKYFPPFGYCIDPLFVMSATYGAAGSQGHSRYFPYYLRDAAVNSSENDVSFAVRMERIGLRNNANGAGMTLHQALAIFASEDDLFLDRAKDATVPASQIYAQFTDAMNNKSNLRRLSENQLSWFATLAPRNVAGSNRAPDEYVLSIVLLYRRSLTNLVVDTDFQAGSNDVAAPERLVEVQSFPGSGIGGGEAVLRFRPNRGVGDLEVRPGDWLMLSGSTDRGSDVVNYSAISINGANYQWNDPGPGVPVPQNRRPFYQWYRVVDADPDVQTDTRNVTLAGPDWPLATTSGTSTTQATLVTGVVSVYERTVKLSFK